PDARRARRPHLRPLPRGQARRVGQLHPPCLPLGDRALSEYVLSREQELDLYGLKWKDDSTIFVTVEHSGGKERRHVPMDSLDVSSSASGSLTDRDWPDSA